MRPSSMSDLRPGRVDGLVVEDAAGDVEQGSLLGDLGEWAAGGGRRLPVAVVVADEPRAGEIELVLALGLEEHARPRLPAGASLVPVVGADVDGGDAAPGGGG